MILFYLKCLFPCVLSSFNISAEAGSMRGQYLQILDKRMQHPNGNALLGRSCFGCMIGNAHVLKDSSDPKCTSVQIILQFCTQAANTHLLLYSCAYKLGMTFIELLQVHTAASLLCQRHKEITK